MKFGSIWSFGGADAGDEWGMKLAQSGRADIDSMDCDDLRKWARQVKEALEKKGLA